MIETVKCIPCIYQFQFNSGTLENIQIFSSKPHNNFYACRLAEPTLGTERTTSEKFQFHIEFKTIEKTSSIMSSSVII